MTESRENGPERPQPEDWNPEHLPEIDRPIGSAVVISADNKILMGLREAGKGHTYEGNWHIPGGGQNEGESLSDTAKRETFEETGVDLTDIELIPLPFVDQGGSPKTLQNGQRVWAKMTFNRFEAHLDQNAADIELQPGDDLAELRWFDESELEHVQQIPGGREFFIKAGYIKPKQP